ncbi:MAG TPA: gfo/Idh/MocA family oxidoreductase, partial [Chryseolinea sp.]
MKSNKNKPTVSRRKFLETSVKATALSTLALGVPSIVPSSVFGKNAPSNRINIGAIGTGRISRGHDLPGVWQYDYAQVIAVCDVDSKRSSEGKTLVNDYYTKRNGKRFDGVKEYSDF